MSVLGGVPLDNTRSHPFHPENFVAEVVEDGGQMPVPEGLEGMMAAGGGRPRFGPWLHVSDSHDWQRFQRRQGGRWIRVRHQSPLIPPPPHRHVLSDAILLPQFTARL